MCGESPDPTLLEHKAVLTDPRDKKLLAVTAPSTSKSDSDVAEPGLL